MPRLATITAAIVILFALFKSGVFEALLMFVMVGAVPSTTITISPSAMLNIVIIASWLAILQAALLIFKVSRQRRQRHLTSYRHSPAIRRRTGGMA